MGPRLEGDAVGKVQEQLHVEQRVPPPSDPLHRLPDRYDLVCRQRELGYSGT